ncbi:cytochrome P450 [Streptomyces gobiensis]|uniref:cytochrome P450 n=1 Tax=Streptomyces gobiensis TaxID=2875706 RepID=UPI0024110BBA|nr:cytochrome P450 [Streptomyces gobiensis]UGY91120.1 cytochrome P450 [Streptomyces gobiensis]
MRGQAPWCWPLLGHLPQFSRRPWDFLGSLSAHGDLVQIRLGRQPGFVACQSGVARQVLADLRTFDRSGPAYERVRKAIGDGLATAAHADHRRQRLLLRPAFTPQRMPEYAAVMHREIQGTVERWQQHQVVDLVQEMFSLTASVALRTLFSSRIGRQATAELRDCFGVFLRSTITQIGFPGIRHVPTPGNRRYTKALDRWRAQVGGIIGDARGAGNEHQDVLAWLLAARDDQGVRLTDAEVSDQVAVLLLAGMETTSAALVWTLQLLGRHPLVLEELHAEVDDVLGGRIADWNDLPRLELTGRIVKEALRLYPPAWFLARFASHETCLAGVRVPSGSMVVVSPYALHRRPDAYSDPYRFDPERWRDPAVGRTAAASGRFLSFSAGPTRCLGESFALAESTLALASIAACWRWQPHHDWAAVPSAPRAVLVPQALPVRLSRR